MEKVEDAVRDWRTTLRLFKKAGGDEPSDYHKRVTLIRMLPMEISTHVTLHWELPDYNSYEKLEKYVFHYIKTITNLKKTSTSIRAAHLVANPALAVEVPDSPPPLPDLDPALLADPEYQQLLDDLLEHWCKEYSGFQREQVEQVLLNNLKGYPTERLQSVLDEIDNG